MRRLVVLIPTAALLIASGLLYAQSGEKASGGLPVASGEREPADVNAARTATEASKKGAKLRRPVAITPEREAAVLTFVQRNHAELADLLGYLKTSQPEEYERAIREIFRTTERLAMIQERDPLQYELEVAAWSAQSHVQLLAARLKMGSSEDLERQLREALLDQNKARLALIKHERQKTAERLTKLDTDIARFEKDREATVQRQLKALTRAAAEGRPAKIAPKTSVKAKKPAPTKNPTN